MAMALPGTAQVQDADPEEAAEEVVYVAPTTFDRIGRVTTPVLINGEGPFTFLVDTGASGSALSRRLVESLAEAPRAGEMLRVRGMTGSEDTATVHIDSLQVGDLLLEDQQFPVISQRILAGADGILGVDGFEDMCLLVRFDSGEVALIREGCPRSRLNWAKVRVRVKFGRLLALRARIEGTEVEAIVDTGAGHSLGNMALMRALGLDRPDAGPTVQTEVMGVTPHRATGSLMTAPKIYLGEARIADLNVTFGDFEVFKLWDLLEEPALLLGMDVLGTVDGFMIDYRREEFRVLPAGSRDRQSIRFGAPPGRIP